eukprot:SAG31_NODE_3424_length_4291_cov_1.659113_7_plen_106_part_00
MHYDMGSCVTIDIMLTQPKDGGSFQTLETNGQLLSHKFERGDAVIFPSHKYHCVQPVVNGTRQVLILELWVGEERSCNHRCEQHFGRCDYVRTVWHNATNSSVAW